MRRQKLLSVRSMAIACSGGSDSMALTLMAQQWAKQHKVKLHVLHVDHRLRQESTREAKHVQHILVKHKINCIILTRRGGDIQTGIMAKARSARYELLLNYCRKHGIEQLWTAHHMDDQAETFIQRMAHDSGLDGLAGIAPVRQVGDIKIVRPLLSVRKQRLEKLIQQLAIDVVRDPSNQRPQFERVRVRQRMHEIAAQGWTVEKLAEVCRLLYQRQTTLNQQTHQWCQNNLKRMGTHASAQHVIQFSHPSWCKQSIDVQYTILKQIVRMQVGAAYPPSSSSLQRMVNQLRTHGGRTISACGVMMWQQKDSVYVVTEWPRHQVSQASATATIITPPWCWRRLTAHHKKVMKNLVVRQLGADGWQQLKSHMPESWQHLPPRVYWHYPSLWRKQQLVAVPHVWRSQNVPSFCVRFTVEASENAPILDVRENDDE